MWAIWQIDLGLSADSFWTAYPKLFWELWRRHQERLKLQHSPIVQMGTFMSMWVNSHLPRDDHGHIKSGVFLTEPSDFIPFSDKPVAATISAPVHDPFAIYAKQAMLQAAATAATPEARAELLRTIKERFGD